MCGTALITTRQMPEIATRQSTLVASMSISSMALVITGTAMASWTLRLSQTLFVKPICGRFARCANGWMPSQCVI